MSASGAVVGKFAWWHVLLAFQTRPACSGHDDMPCVSVNEESDGLCVSGTKHRQAHASALACTMIGGLCGQICSHSCALLPRMTAVSCSAVAVSVIARPGLHLRHVGTSCCPSLESHGAKPWLVWCHPHACRCFW